MSQSFDPYFRWLGIRDPQRPPNHYRLLGIDLFESDPDIVAGAADRQMAHIRSFQTGQYAELSQKILNELAAARVCLLKPERKLAYDNSLRVKIASTRVASPPRVAAVAAVGTSRPVVAEPVRTDVESPFTEIMEAASASPSSRRKRKKQSSLAPVALVTMLFVAAAVFGLITLNANQRPQAAHTKPSARLNESEARNPPLPRSPTESAASHNEASRESEPSTGVPQAAWLKTVLRDRMEDALDRTEQGDWYHYETIDRLWREHASGIADYRRSLWNFLFSFPFQST